VREVCLSSELRSATAAELAAAGVKPQPVGGRLIDDFSQGWRDWYRLNIGNPDHWGNWTRKITDPAWRGPEGTTLAMKLALPRTNTITVVLVENEWRGEAGEVGRPAARIPTGRAAGPMISGGAAAGAASRSSLHSTPAGLAGARTAGHWRAELHHRQLLRIMRHTAISRHLPTQMRRPAGAGFLRAGGRTAREKSCFQAGLRRTGESGLERG
jgi:hypothetical protein